ncbi:MAG: polysaccharide biosynthesis/export family protein [Terriglobales bacterium]
MAAAARAQQAPVAPAAAAQRLEPGDLIAVSVFEAPELATEARLDARGAVTVPQAGRVELAGKTAAAAGAAIAARLRPHYLLDPQVEVTVRQFASDPVAVLGAVGRPGVYSARLYPDLAALLAAAGGVQADSGSRVLLSHAGSSQPVMSVDAVALLRQTPPPWVPVRSGDTVRVEPASAVYIGGAVVKPGAYAMPASGLTLLEALMLAGGPGPDARLAGARIVHHGGQGWNQTQWLDARPVVAGRALDPALRPLDMVYIPSSLGRAALLHGLQTTVATGAAILSGLIVFH